MLKTWKTWPVPRLPSRPGGCRRRGMDGVIDRQIIEASRRRRAYIFVEAPTDSELEWLYRRCLFTVFASKVEGWDCRSARPVVRQAMRDGSYDLPAEVGGDLCVH